jgi:hypothetical protein
VSTYVRNTSMQHSLYVRACGCHYWSESLEVWFAHLFCCLSTSHLSCMVSDSEEFPQVKALLAACCALACRTRPLQSCCGNAGVA